MKRKRGKIVSDQRLQSVSTERKHKEENKEMKSPCSNTVILDEPKYRDTIAVAFNENMSDNKLNEANTVKIIDDKSFNIVEKETEDNVFPCQDNEKSDDVFPSQSNQKSDHVDLPDDMTKKIIDEMDTILMEVKKDQDKQTLQGLVECGLWDFAGQKDYYVTHQLFLNPHAIYLLVADISEDIEAVTGDEDFDSIGGNIAISMSLRRKNRHYSLDNQICVVFFMMFYT